MTGNVPIARLLVKLPGLDVNLADNEGNTALHLAAQAGITKSNQALSICNWLDIHEMSCRSRRYRQSTHVVSQSDHRHPQQRRPNRIKINSFPFKFELNY
jgi:hypothetical protein